MTHFLDELAWRGLLHQTTGDDVLRAHLDTPGRVVYCGFDPTSHSLTIGNLIAINLLVHAQRCGHKPIVLMGGGTGLIGDPSGKDAERTLMTRDQVQANVDGQRRIFDRLLSFEGEHAAVVVNNVDWLGELGFLEVLRDVGKHFSVNAMIQKDSVRDRLQNREQGISYTEFSYMLLQAYDFLHLHRTMNCTVQAAGSDQYGNIVSGIDLIRREFGHDDDGHTPAYGVTAPLVTRADGKKIGKSEKGAVWLTADLTSPYQFYQFWINVSDHDVISFLKWFTLFTEDEVNAIDAQHEAAPHERAAQTALARHMTERLHGADAVARAEAASSALFTGDVASLDDATIDEVFGDVPSSDHERTALDGDGVSLVSLLPTTSLAASKREAKEFLSNGAVTVNGANAGLDRMLTTADLLHGRHILIRRGKKKWHATKWQ